MQDNKIFILPLHTTICVFVIFFVQSTSSRLQLLRSAGNYISRSTHIIDLIGSLAKQPVAGRTLATHQACGPHTACWQ